MRVLTTLEELDAVVAEVQQAGRRSDDAMREVFASFRMDYPGPLPPDPHSPEYREAQMALYRRIAGRDYTTANESSVFDVEAAVLRPFPYYTGSCPTVGAHLMAMGHAIRCLDLPAGSTVLEFGPGWGNTTLALAMSGFKVTAVDIEARFCDLIARRARMHGVDIATVNDDFSYIERAAPVDAVLFFECFHHAADHQRVMAAFDRVVKPGGKVLFASEPISADFPVPWGLRLDGESLWAIRQNGWLELGYNESYFHEALARVGWTARRHDLPSLSYARFLEARRHEDWAQHFAGDAPQLQSQGGVKAHGVLRVASSAPGYFLYGPYAHLPEGRWQAEVGVAAGARGACRIEVSSGERVLAAREVALADSPGITLDFTLEATTPGVEVRMHSDAPVELTITRVTLRPR